MCEMQDTPCGPDVFPDTSGPLCFDSVSPPLAQAHHEQLWAVSSAGSFDSAGLTLSMVLGVHVRTGRLPFFIL